MAIGTRGSALALAQARIVEAALEREGRPTRMVIIETEGDRREPDTTWGEGAFVAAIEGALRDGRIDVAVHSAKDIPIEKDGRLRIAAYLPRADPRDALVVRRGASERSLLDLNPGTLVGTDSPRRTGFVRAIRPDLVVHPLHGNVDTRLHRLDEGETDALVLACAGLDRLGLESRIAERLSPDLVPPAPGQGAIALQIRADDGRMLAVCAAIDDPRTRVAVEAERAFLETSGGGCRAPVGALATFVGGDLELLVGRAETDGSVTTVMRRVGTAATGGEMAVALAHEVWASHAERVSNATDPTARRRRVLVPRSEEQSVGLAVALRNLGLEPVMVPAIAIEIDPPRGDLDRAATALDRYRWVVVTSPNGARALLAATERVPAGIGGPRWAAIGPGTAGVLEQTGIPVDFRPSASLAQAVADELPVADGDGVLVVRGDLAGTTLAERLRARGATVDDVVAYRTTIAPAPSVALLRAASVADAFDAVILTSGSTIAGLRRLGEAADLDVTAIPAICIGPETQRAAEAAGFRVVAVSPSPDPRTVAATSAASVPNRSMEPA